MLDRIYRAVVITLLLVLAVALIMLGIWFVILILEAFGLY